MAKGAANATNRKLPQVIVLSWLEGAGLKVAAGF
jgi:hypothetical protein